MNNEYNKKFKGEFLVVEEDYKNPNTFYFWCYIIKDGVKKLIKSPPFSTNPYDYIKTRNIKEFDVIENNGEFTVDISNLSFSDLNKYQIKYFNENKTSYRNILAFIKFGLLVSIFTYITYFRVIDIKYIAYIAVGISNIILIILFYNKIKFNRLESINIPIIKIKRDLSGENKYKLTCGYSNSRDQRNYIFTGIVDNLLQKLAVKNIKEIQIKINPKTFEDYRLNLDELNEIDIKKQKFNDRLLMGLYLITIIFSFALILLINATLKNSPKEVSEPVNIENYIESLEE